MFGLLDHLKEEAAVIEGAPISFAAACLAAFGICYVLFRSRLTFLSETIADYKERLAAISPAQLSKSIRINLPATGSSVQHEIFVQGTVKPRGSEVQVFVLAGNGRWYPQDRATYSGDTWTARCWIGSPETARGAAFQIVAIDGGQRLREPVDQLPIDVARSRTLTLYRA